MLKAVAMGPKVPYIYCLAKHTKPRLLMGHVQRAREMLSKQTTIDYDGEVSTAFEFWRYCVLKNIGGYTWDSGMSALLLARHVPPLASPHQFCSASH